MIDYNKSAIEKFYKKEENAIYQYGLYWDDALRTDDEVHSNFDKCYNEAFDFYEEEFKNNEIRDFCIIKKYSGGGQITLFLNSEQNGYEFHITGMNFLEKERDICNYLS